MRRAEEREARRQRELSEIHAQMEAQKAQEQARLQEEAFWNGVTQAQRQAKRDHKALREEASRAAMAKAHLLNVYGIPMAQTIAPETVMTGGQTPKSLRPAVLRAIQATDTTPVIRVESTPHSTEAPWFLDSGNAQNK